MSQASLIFPHQLFKDNPCLQVGTPVYLIEEYLFFNQYRFHKKKLLFHRASMLHYRNYLQRMGYQVNYMEATYQFCHINELVAQLAGNGVTSVVYADACDDWLRSRLEQACQQQGILTICKPSPLFMNSPATIEEFFAERGHLSQTGFYIRQRKKNKILVDGTGKPAGGKWTYDVENRKKIPATVAVPPCMRVSEDPLVEEAQQYVNKHYPENPGDTDGFLYPVTHKDAELWLEKFLSERFSHFGDYEDAISRDESFLFHSVLSPLLNSGLLLPGQVIDAAMEYAAENAISLNSLEGFIRQILGWREFMQGVYHFKGRRLRSGNFWGHQNRLPEAFYTAATGVLPVDNVIRKTLTHAYAHHIERLMILGNFMLLGEVHPDDVYRWFMEMYIDAYDWVMVPNVYAMSQFADGGLITTKPYISGSNYILKMSNFPKGQWCAVWDSLFWRFINKNAAFFRQNPRMNMLVNTWLKMDRQKQAAHLEQAERFLSDMYT